jgi:hypothetical protein
MSAESIKRVTEAINAARTISWYIGRVFEGDEVLFLGGGLDGIFGSEFSVLDGVDIEVLLLGGGWDGIVGSEFSVLDGVDIEVVVDSNTGFELDDGFEVGFDVLARGILLDGS